jgi:microcystin-dependent protein
MIKKCKVVMMGFACSMLLAGTMVWSTPAQASEPFLAQITMFAGNFAPRGWAFCDGQLLSINQNPALFSLLGTTFGGDGRTTFGLPDLRGRTAIGPRSGPGLTDHRLGEKGGTETVTLNESQIPGHSHTATAVGTDATGNSETPGGNTWASRSRDRDYSSNAPDANMKAGSVTIANTGGGQSHPNMQPFIAINHIIALVGVFPSRN